MKKINEKVQVKLELETDDMAEIQRLLSLSGLVSKPSKEVQNNSCNVCGEAHEGTCEAIGEKYCEICDGNHTTDQHNDNLVMNFTEQVDNVNLNYEEWYQQMVNDGAKVFKSMDPENPNAGVTAYAKNGRELGRFSGEVDETRGDEEHFDWGHRKYTGTGFTGDQTPDATDFYGRGDLRVRMHGRGDNAMYNALMKEWQEFLGEYSNKEPKIGAAIVLKRGITLAEINEIDEYLKQNQLGSLRPHPRLSNKAIYIPFEIIDDSGLPFNLDKAVEKMKSDVEAKFKVQPFLDDWKIMYLFEKIDKSTGNGIFEVREIMNGREVLDYVWRHGDIERLRLMDKTNTGDTFDIVGVKKQGNTGYIIAFDGIETFEVNFSADKQFELDRDAEIIYASDVRALMERDHNTPSMEDNDKGESLYSKGLAISRDNYAKLLKSMNNADLENECANQIYLSAHHANEYFSDSHWRVEMCQDEAEKRDPNLYDRAMQKAQRMK